MSREIINSNNTPKQKKITLLVDSNFLLKRSFTAKTEKYNKHGHIGALYSFMMTTRKLVRDLSINKCCLMWDGENGGKMRYNLYEGYKANRKNKEWHIQIQMSDAEIERDEQSRASLLAQRIRVKQYAEELFLRQIEVPLIEADDLIAQYCKKYHKEEKIYIFTNDRDMCILLDYDNVNIYLDNKKTIINKHNYFLNFKHHYKNCVLLKTICGDSSDNIKGIKGVQEKTLLEHFPEIKTREVTYQEIIEKAKQINDQREIKVKGQPKLKRLVALDNIINGTIVEDDKRGNKKDVNTGLEIYELNAKLVDLRNPFLNKQAIAEIAEIGEYALDIENRGSKNLMEMMTYDDFLQDYMGNFVDFVKPFYPIILQEKEFANE